MTECSVCGWRHTSGNCGKDDCPRPIERTPCEHLYDIACRELDEVRAQRDELLAALKEMRDACAAALRAMSVSEGATGAFLPELRAAGIRDGFGVRADAAIAKAEAK
jgi:hypothetical protein